MQLSQGPIGELIENQPIHIYGAGISGLLMGLYLKRHGHRVTIFETSKVAGGKIQTKNCDYGIIETAANAIYTNDDVYELLDSLKLEYIKSSKKLKRKVWRNNKAKSPPFFLKEILKILFGIFKKVPINTNDLTIEGFFTPLTGKRFCSEVISSALGGVYAEDASKLHFESVFKTSLKNQTYFSFFRSFIKSRKNKQKATSISFEGGMQTFINALRNELHHEISFETSPVIGQSVNNIICTDAIDASELLFEAVPKISNELKKIKYNHLSTSTFFTNKSITFLEKSFGILFPQFLKQKTIGMLNNSAIFSARTHHQDHYSYTVISKEKESNQNTIYEEFLSISKLSTENILFSQKSEWSRAIPIYDKNRYDTIMSIRSKMIECPRGLIIFGNYVDGISIREMISMACKFATKNSIKNNTQTSPSLQNTSTSEV